MQDEKCYGVSVSSSGNDRLQYRPQLIAVLSVKAFNSSVTAILPSFWPLSVQSETSIIVILDNSSPSKQHTYLQYAEAPSRGTASRHQIDSWTSGGCISGCTHHHSNTLFMGLGVEVCDCDCISRAAHPLPLYRSKLAPKFTGGTPRTPIQSIFT